MERYGTFVLKSCRRLKVCDFDLNIAQDLVLERILYLILQDYNRFEDMFHCNYDILGIIFGEVLLLSRVDMLLIFCERM
jgi:hypothetical protein